MKTTFLLSLAAGLLSLASGSAGNLRCPEDSFKFDEAAARRGSGTILEITKPVENESSSRWNGVDIVIPEELKYHSDLAFRGKIKVETAGAPSHLACQLTTADGKIGFVMLVKSPFANEIQAFDATVDQIKITPDSKVDEPFSERDIITKIGIYASFSQPADSKMTLQELAIFR